MSLRVQCASVSFWAGESQLFNFQEFGELIEIFLIVSNWLWWEFLHWENWPYSTQVWNSHQCVTPQGAPEGVFSLSDADMPRLYCDLHVSYQWLPGNLSPALAWPKGLSSLCSDRCAAGGHRAPCRVGTLCPASQERAGQPSDDGCDSSWCCLSDTRAELLWPPAPLVLSSI